jgi:4-amino-4-deoxy-L-arabinose transferase-like glycosyltransferase
MTGKFRYPLHAPLSHALILLVLSLPYFTRLGSSSLWDANEAFYAETPREMLVSGDYLAPRFNFQARAQKPPLTYWIVLASYKVLGVNEFALRFPGALAAAGTLLFSYGFTRLLFGPRAALAAALMVATTPRVFILARRLPIDILLLLFMTATLFCVIRAILRNDTIYWASASLLAALGFLTKGPIAVVVPAGAALIWALRARRLRFSASPLVIGSAVFLAAALPWYLLIYRAHGWTYISPFFLRDNVGRFAFEAFGPSRGPFYFIPVALADFFPWSLFALAAIYLLWRGRKAEEPLKSLSFGVPLVWCALVFLLFSLSKNKQEYYIAPLYPAAAAIVAGVLEKTLFAKGGRGPVPGAISSGQIDSPAPHAWIWPCAATSLSLLALSALTLVALRPLMPDMPPVLHYAPVLLFAGAGVLTGYPLLRKKTVPSFSALAVSLWIFYWMVPLFYLPTVEPFRPVKDFCRLIEAQSRAGDEVGFYGTALPSMVYYLRRPIFEENNADRMRRRFESGRRVFCVLTERDYEYFRSVGGVDLHVLDRRARLDMRLRSLIRSGSPAGETLLLVSNRPYS